MSTSIAAFQDAFAQALLAPDAVPADARVARLTAQPGFAVYRNTVMKGAIDSLQANYPAVARLVGEEWFRAAAAVYVRASPPARATLLYYGAGFADFLAGFGPARELPYLPDVARLDRFWTEAHAAPDEMPVLAAAVAALAPDVVARAVLRPHASARRAWFENAPAVTIWRRNREPDDGTGVADLDWRGEGALVVRPYGVVESHDLDRAGCAFLDRCAAGASLGEAAAAALDSDPRVDLAGLMARLLGAGAFGRLEFPAARMEDRA
jgi:hypothetical protein